MTTIYKYELWATDLQIMAMPKGAILRHVAFQGNKLMLWAQVATNQPTVGRTIHIYGTGHDMVESETLTYVGTAFQDYFVWHVFDGGEE
jgi:hypothetical protein